MKFKDIYNLAIELGMEADPRGREGAEKALAAARKNYEKLDDKEKAFFDIDSLTNPYADSRILNGDEEDEVAKMIVGIDIEPAELLLTEALNQRGAGIDLVMSHHPEGRALAALDEVMWLQPGAWANAGVLRNVAEDLLEGRAKEVEISVGGGNYNRTVDAAAALGLKMLCLHTPCDNLVNRYLTELMAAKAPEDLSQVIDLLLEIPEYATAAKRNNAPLIVAGSPSRSAGKIFVDMTGGTGGPKEYYRLLVEAGISTVICMHAGKEAIAEAKDCHLNVIIAGHMASDSLGINLFLDEVEARGVEVVPISGLIRVKRK